MQIRSFVAQDTAGNRIAGASVDVFVKGTQTLAGGLLAPDGADLTNPMTADPNGVFSLQAPDGLYDIKVTNPLGGAPAQTPSVQFFDPKTYGDLAELLADAGRTYANGGAVAGEILYGGQYPMEVLPAGATGANHTTAGGLLLKVVQIANTVCPAMFNADDTGLRICSTEVNAFVQYCVAENVAGVSFGDFSVDRTIAPGGLYQINWGHTRLLYAGSDVTELTELSTNPSGATHTPAGKYVLFDTAGCASSENYGSLTIRGSARANMTLEQESTIPRDLVALSCSTGQSSDMIWSSIFILGCGHALWTGDMQGTAPVILPYTRWVVSMFKAQFCWEAVSMGKAGNSLDDGAWLNVHLTRNRKNGTIRTDWVINSILLKGKNFDNDAEAATVSAAGDQVTLSADVLDEDQLSRIVPGMVIAIEGAGDDTGAATPNPHVSRIASKDGLVLTIDTPVKASISGARVLFNPGSFIASNACFTAQHIYTEQVLDAAIQLATNGKVICPDMKFTDGNGGGRYGAPIVVTGLSGTLVDITLNQRSGKNNNRWTYMVAWPTLQSGGVANRGTVKIKTRDSEDDFAAGASIQPIGVVKLEEDHAAGNSTAAGVMADMRQNLSCRFDNGKRMYHALIEGPAMRGPLVSDYDHLSLGTNQRAEDTMTGITATGACGAVSSGVVEKDADGIGTWYEATGTLTAGDLHYVEFMVDEIPAAGVTFDLFRSQGAETPAGTPMLPGGGVPIRGAGLCKFHVVVPAGLAPNRIGFQCFSTSRVTISRLVFKKVIVN